jgi:tetratricopeptide (TPR) repeat protein
MKALYALLLLLSIALPGAQADQNDPSLDGLFKRLQESADAEEGKDITQEIWMRWHRIDNPDIAALLRSGVALMTAGVLENALIVFDRVVERAPDFAEGWNKRATILYLLDRNDESLIDIRRTLELEPRHFGALSGLGLIYLEAGRYRAALIAFQKARDINPYMPGVDENIEYARNKLKEGTI